MYFMHAFTTLSPFLFVLFSDIYVFTTYMYVQSMYSIYKVWISPLINTKNTIGVQQIVYEALCNCAMGYFTSIFRC